MAAASAWISAPFNYLRQNQPTTFHPSSALRSARPCFRFIIPNILIFSSATVTTSFSRWPKETTVRSAADNRVVEGNNEYNENGSSWAQAAWAVRSGMEKGSGQYNDDDSSRGITKFPRPQEVPWQKELANTVHFIGVIGRAVQFKYTQSGKAFAWTRIGVRSGSDEETMWFTLTFWNELAETAAQHLKKNDRVYVSGFLALQTPAGENDQPKIYKVIARTLNFVERTSPEFSQVVVNKKTPSIALYEQAVIHKDAPLPYQKFPVKSSSSGKNTQEDAATIESLWQAFFASPFEWWDNRNNKRNPRAPDFKHKDTGEALWIDSRYTPLWVKSQLDVLDSRMKDFGEWGGGRSSARDQACEIHHAWKYATYVTLPPFYISLIFVLLFYLRRQTDFLLMSEHRHTCESTMMAFIIYLLDAVIFISEKQQDVAGRCFLTFCVCFLVFMDFWVRMGKPIYLCVFKSESEMKRFEDELRWCGAGFFNKVTIAETLRHTSSSISIRSSQLHDGDWILRTMNILFSEKAECEERINLLEQRKSRLSVKIRELEEESLALLA